MAPLATWYRVSLYVESVTLPQDCLTNTKTYCDAEWSTIVCATSSDDGGSPSISFWARRIGVQRKSIKHPAALAAENRRHNKPATVSTMSTIRSVIGQLLDLLLKAVMGVLLLFAMMVFVSELLTMKKTQADHTGQWYGSPGWLASSWREFVRPALREFVVDVLG